LKSKGKKELFIIFFVFSIVLSISHLMLEELFFGDNTETIAIDNGIKKTYEREKITKEFLVSSKNNLQSIYNLKAFKEYIKDKNYNNHKIVEDLFFSLSVANKSFMQLRYIDKFGFEKVRVDRATQESNPYIVPQENLQNKSNRYYFVESQKKEPNRVWFSSIDLNIEYGEVEIPYKPTLRATMPIYIEGKFEGIVIINHFFKSFLDRLSNAPLYDVILYNNDGYTLKHYDDTKSWGYYQKPQITIENEFVKEYKNILSTNILKEKTFVSRKFDVEIENGLNIVIKLKESYLKKQQKKNREEYILITLFIFGISVAISIAIVKLMSNTILNLNQVKYLNEQIKSASKVAKIGFWEFDSSDKSLDWSSGVYEIFEIDRGEKIDYERFLSFVPVEDRGRIDKKFLKSLQEKKEYFVVHQIVTNSGNIKYVEERGKHYYSNSGEHTKTIGSVYDITKRYLSEKKYKTLLNLASEGVFLMRSDGRLLEYSNMVKDLLGYKDKELKNLSVFDWDKNLTQENFESTKEILSEKPITFERVHTRADGTTYDAQISASKVLINNEYYIYTSVRDITRYNRYQNEIIKQKEALEAIFDTALEGIALLSLDGKYQKFNKKYLELLGYSEKELEGKSCFDFVTDEYKEETKRVINIVLEDGSYEDFERDCVVKGGEVRRFKSSIALMPNKNELLMTTVDYTELYRAYQTIKKQTFIDELTGVNNRKFYNQKIGELFNEYQKESTPFSLILFDLDYFKSINDTYGHLVGDEVLKDVCSLVEKEINSSDYLCRVGGEEFVVLVPNTSLDSATTLATHLKNSIQNNIKAKEKIVTISAGVAQINSKDSVESIYKRADDNLYSAKHNGRNMVVSS
jgi:diguanylate cyclase (GGDEF)-like protein/PAS domain S-box-containing protein